MLIEFKVKNFKSFRDEQTLSMIAHSDQTLIDENTALVSGFKRRLLKSSVVYGANASGKSNLIQALAFVKDFVSSSATSPQDKINVSPFRCNPIHVTEPTEFTIDFVTEDTRYEYGFSVKDNRITSETLIAYPKGLPQKWFERFDTLESKASIEFGTLLKGEKERLTDLTPPNVLFLSIARNYNKQLRPVYRWFRKYLRIIDARLDAGYYYTAEQSIKNSDFREMVVSFLKFADLGISDFIVDQEETTSTVGKLPTEIQPAAEQFYKALESSGLNRLPNYSIRFKHWIEDNPETVFEFEEESLGTQRLFTLVGPWIDSLQNGYTLIVDELDSSLHPLLIIELLHAFHNPNLNTSNAQLIFNAHDVSLLDEADLLRRDQIWFVEKDNQGATQLYSLLDYKTRKEDLLARRYLRGRFGAVPIIGDVELVKRVSEDDEE